jgi:drug/metabolite transporter (DMT)-like permease
MRTSAIALLLGALAVLGGESFKLTRAAWPSFLGQALATFTVSASYLASIQFIPVGLAVIIFFAFPVIVVVVSPLVEGRALSLPRMAVAVLAFIGLAIAVGPGFDALDIRGVLLAEAAAIGCALQFFTGRALGHHLQPAAFGSLVHLAIWPMVALVALYSGEGHLQIMNSNGLAYLFVAGVCLAYLGGYFLHMSSLKAAPASVVAPYFNLEPIVTTVISTILLAETLKPNQYGGGAIVLAALLLAGLLGKREDTA